MKPSFTFINDKQMKGLLVLGLNKKAQEDIVDFVELSAPSSRRETDHLIRQRKDRVPMENVHANVRKT